MARTPVQNVGIIAAEIYFPSTYVSQVELETKDNCAGKYTIGFGQNNMAFCTYREDVASICLTVVQSLLEKYDISNEKIGRLEVGTETIIDHSKSVKSVLMQLFKNTDIEGIDTTNACYGGTSALINAVNWIESSSWDGRYALVVASDIAIYPEGPARPTGGCGAVALLIGPNAPFVIESGTRSTHSEDVNDFYKPNLSSEYPFVDGRFSLACFTRGLDITYNRYKQKYAREYGQDINLSKIDYLAFHSPFNKLVRKSFGRLLWNDHRGIHTEFGESLVHATSTAIKRNPDAQSQSLVDELVAFDELTLGESYSSVPLERELVKLTEKSYNEKVFPSVKVSQEVGNMYTASLFGAIVSLISGVAPETLSGKRVVCYSYGSGMCATMYGILIRGTPEEIKNVADKIQLQKRLEERIGLTHQEFRAVLEEREILTSRICSPSNIVFKPQNIPENLTLADGSDSWAEKEYLDKYVRSGSYYIERIDKNLKRYYSRKL